MLILGKCETRSKSSSLLSDLSECRKPHSTLFLDGDEILASLIYIVGQSTELVFKDNSSEFVRYTQFVVSMSTIQKKNASRF